MINQIINVNISSTAETFIEVLSGKQGYVKIKEYMYYTETDKNKASAYSLFASVIIKTILAFLLIMLFTERFWAAYFALY
jgi:hypothetical protein